MINTVAGFTQTTFIADGFSDLIIKLYGSERGLHARSAIGVQALPMDFPVIIDALVEIDRGWYWYMRDEDQGYPNKPL